MQNYTLIITEKPDAAQRIAEALDVTGKPQKRSDKGVPYYAVCRDRQIIIVPALGHLYTVAQEGTKRNQYPVFNFKWVPRYIAERGATRIRAWISTISKLAQNADTFIDACDYDIEGSLIGYTILKHACNNKDAIAKRMKYSTLTKQELEKAYSQILPHLDFTLIEAGQARHEIDWLYGINLSRALTAAAKSNSGKYTNLSTGRVQGPTLKFLVAREKTIQTHVPTPYWQIKAILQINNQTYEVEHEKKAIETKKEANIILNDCQDKNGQVEKIETKQYQQPPPYPFDLGTLQTEAYRLFGYTPKYTLNVAQQLYLQALISYPRTSSQKLPPTINYNAILQSLNKNPQYTKLTAELLSKPKLGPNQGKKDDPAHPAIYPTGNHSQKTLDTSEKNILDLITRRFMATFGEPATKQTMKATININGHHFHVRGKQIVEEGWTRFYQPYARYAETLLPPLQEDQVIIVKKIILEDKFTEPPTRYNPSSLLKQMEKTEIGTKATRADIIQTLCERKYVTDEGIKVTDLGFTILQVLEQYCPTIISIKFTRELEQKMNNIRESTDKKETILTDTIETLKPIINELKQNEKAIGETLSEAIRKAQIEERIIGPCPTCKTGNLAIIYSRKTGKRFIGCTNYFKGLCKTAFPLPQKGNIKPLRTNCRNCGWPTIQVRMHKKRPWKLCFNPTCPQKEDRRKQVEMQNM